VANRPVGHRIDRSIPVILVGVWGATILIKTLSLTAVAAGPPSPGGFRRCQPRSSRVCDWIRYQGQPDRPQPDAELLGFGPRYRLYETSVGWVFLACTNESEWAAPAAETGLAASARDDHDLAEQLDGTFRTRPADEWELRLLAAGVGCVRADGRGYIQFSTDEPVLRQTGSVVSVAHPELGSYERHAPLVSLSRTPSRAGAAAGLGQLTRAILAELGYAEAAIADLASSRVIGVPEDR
jgi:crotonobetainyl-CoA:carnitine CoA-transferase CaiB-like acyl-CoA transferase